MYHQRKRTKGGTHELLRLRLQLLRKRLLLADVEADVQDVAVRDDVGLSFHALEAPAPGLGARAGLDEVAPANDLAPDEAARAVRVDLARRGKRGLAAMQCPGAGLGVPGREERNQVGGLEDLAQHRLQSRRPLAELGRLLRWHLRELGLELQVDPTRSVLDHAKRLGRQRLARPPARPRRQRETPAPLR